MRKMKNRAIAIGSLVLVLTFIGVGLMPWVSAAGTTVSINSGSSGEGGTVVVSLMIRDADNLGSAVVNLTYDAAVVTVIDVTNSDFDQPPNLYTMGEGWVLLQAGQFASPLNDDVKMCDITLQAKGNTGDTSPLNLMDVVLEDFAMQPITVDTVGGTFTITGSATKSPTGATVAPTAGTTATPTVTPGVSPTPTPAVSPFDTHTPTPGATPPPEEPGFEAVFAIAGLLTIAYIVLRARRE